MERKGESDSKGGAITRRNGMGGRQICPERHQILGDDGRSDARSGYETRAQDADQTLAQGVEGTQEDQDIDSRLRGHILA